MSSQAPIHEGAHGLVKFIFLQMKAEGMSMEELSRRTQIDDMTIRSWFTGKNGPSLYKVEKVLNVFGYSVKPTPLIMPAAAPPKPVKKRRLFPIGVPK